MNIFQLYVLLNLLKSAHSAQVHHIYLVKFIYVFIFIYTISFLGGLGWCT